MNYLLTRTYNQDGTTGELSIGGYVICNTIELPNLNNQHEISCIPEGEYNLAKQYSAHLGNVILLENVPDRSGIYIHPANDASTELKGCIAPVFALTGEDSGITSKPCFNGIRAHVYAAINNGEKVTLTIKAKTEHGT